MKGIMPLMMMREQAGQRAEAAEAARAGAQQTGFAGALADIDVSEGMTPGAFRSNVERIGAGYQPGAGPNIEAALEGAENYVLAPQERLSLMGGKVGALDYGGLGARQIKNLASGFFDPEELRQQAMELPSRGGILDVTGETPVPTFSEPEIGPSTTPSGSPLMEPSGLLRDIGSLVAERQTGLDIEANRAAEAVGAGVLASRTATAQMDQMKGDRDWALRAAMDFWGDERTATAAGNEFERGATLRHLGAMGAHAQLVAAAQNVAREMVGAIEQIRVKVGLEQRRAGTPSLHNTAATFLRNPVRVQFLDGSERTLRPGWMGVIYWAENGRDVLGIMDIGTLTPNTWTTASSTHQAWMLEQDFEDYARLNPEDPLDALEIDRINETLRTQELSPIGVIGRDAGERDEAMTSLENSLKRKVQIVTASQVPGGPSLLGGTDEGEIAWQEAVARAQAAEADGSMDAKVAELLKIEDQYRSWISTGTFPREPDIQELKPFSQFVDEMMEFLDDEDRLPSAVRPGAAGRLRWGGRD